MHQTKLETHVFPQSRHPVPRPWNPLAPTDGSIHPHSSYMGLVDGSLKKVLAASEQPGSLESEIHAQLVGKILDSQFPCVAARSAFNRSGYRFGLYSNRALRMPEGLCHDLYEFSHEFSSLGDGFGTFMAVFPDAPSMSEVQFEAFLWSKLQSLHDIDAEHFEWSDQVSDDPESSEFSFSIGARAYFIVGLHPHASRRSRVAPWPVIVFNPHDQFERLRARGKYESMQKAIRGRDIALQGDINPVLSNFGERSETRQYSGRKVTEEWKCPFHSATENKQ